MPPRIDIVAGIFGIKLTFKEGAAPLPPTRCRLVQMVDGKMVATEVEDIYAAAARGFVFLKLCDSPKVRPSFAVNLSARNWPVRCGMATSFRYEDWAANDRPST